MVTKIVITGASGRLGAALRVRLAKPGRELLLVDALPVPGPLLERESSAVADIRDEKRLEELFEGAQGIVHLAGFPSERPWAEIADVNIGGTLCVLRAMTSQGVTRIFHASSVHASGFEPTEAPGLVARPDTFYGVGKLAAEGLIQLYADRHRLYAMSARIANFAPEPDSIRGLSMWLSPDDAGRLVEAGLALSEPGHSVVWGVSRNSRGVLDLGPGELCGFSPVDDAEAYAASVEAAEAGKPAPEPTVRLGAGFTLRPLGQAT